jgi:hypothetical protein
MKISLNEDNSVISCDVLDSDSTIYRGDIEELIKIIGRTLSHWKRPVLVHFTGLGHSYKFESQNEIDNFRALVTFLIPHIMRGTVNKINKLINDQKRTFDGFI